MGSVEKGMERLTGQAPISVRGSYRRAASSRPVVGQLLHSSSVAVSYPQWLPYRMLDTPDVCRRNR